MRLWSLHPKYLDPQGLVALWREGLLAQAVLRGNTRGYRNHPQLARFLAHPSPRSAINGYLRAVHSEATSRGYTFERSKIGPARDRSLLSVTDGQLAYEWEHLMAKLSARSPTLRDRWVNVGVPEPHPLFRVRRGDVEPWERVRSAQER